MTRPDALPFLQPPADRLAAYAKLVGDFRLIQLFRKAHAVRCGNAEVCGELDQPVGKNDVGILVALAVLCRDGIEEAARRKLEEAGPDRRIDVEE